MRRREVWRRNYVFILSLCITSNDWKGLLLNSYFVSSLDVQCLGYRITEVVPAIVEHILFPLKKNWHIILLNSLCWTGTIHTTVFYSFLFAWNKMTTSEDRAWRNNWSDRITITEDLTKSEYLDRTDKTAFRIYWPPCK